MSTYQLDLHVHTVASPDGCSTLETLVSAAKERGLDAIAITDHNLCTPCPDSMDGVLLIPGCEISTAVGHITGLFLRKPIDLEKLGRLPSGESAMEAIHAAGGIGVIAHPFQRPDTGKETFSFPVDGVETANARACMKVADANEKAAALALERNLPRIGGSDAHHAGEVGNAYTIVESPELTADALREAVSRGNTQAVLCRKTTHREKARSQWAKARKSGSPKLLLRGIAYWVYSVLLDAIGR